MTGIAARLRRLEHRASPPNHDIVVVYVDALNGAEEEAYRVRVTPTGNLRSEDGGRTWRPANLPLGRP
jgi:hypothetical protein